MRDAARQPRARPIAPHCTHGVSMDETLVALYADPVDMDVRARSVRGLEDENPDVRRTSPRSKLCNASNQRSAAWAGAGRRGTETYCTRQLCRAKRGCCQREARARAIWVGYLLRRMSANMSCEKNKSPRRSLFGGGDGGELGGETYQRDRDIVVLAAH